MKLSKKNRKALRALYLGLGVTAVSTVFYSCPGGIGIGGAYGPAPAPPSIQEQIYFQGGVISKNTGKPIPGIAVNIIGITEHYVPLTDSDGYFYYYLPVQESYTIVLTDIDGIENGGHFKQLTLTLTKEECEILYKFPLIIEMEEVDQEIDESEEADEE